MKIRQYLFSLVLLLALFLAACSSQTAPTEEMSEGNDMTSETASEAMKEKDDDRMDDEVMSEGNDEMSDHDGDSMNDNLMDNKDGSAMKDDDTMRVDEDDMDDHSDDELMEDKDDDSVSDEKDDMSNDSMIISPDWFKTSLTDINTGETFVVADFKGKVVLVETLAMWCSNCLKQQGQVKALHDLVGERDDFVSLGLDIDPNENATALKSYTSNNEFDWFYAIAPTEVSRELSQLYGDQYLNPPSTPMLIIDREGEVHLLPFGIKSAEDLFEALQPFLNSEM